MAPTNWQYVLQGDVEAACINLLKDAPEITGFAGGAPRVSSDLQGFQMGARWVMVSREGGSLAWPKIDYPRLDFNIYGETRKVAHDLAQVAQAVMFRSMDSTFPQFGVRITNVKVETGILRAPDPSTGSLRYVFALRLTCVPFTA